MYIHTYMYMHTYSCMYICIYTQVGTYMLIDRWIDLFFLVTNNLGLNPPISNYPHQTIYIKLPIYL